MCENLIMKYISIKKISLFLSIACVLCSCESQKKYTQVQVEPILSDSLNIRAIEVVSDQEIWFAANRGRIGVYNGRELAQIALHHNDSLLHFRSIAHNGIHAFALTIDRPALLYRLTYDGKQIINAELVYKEDAPKVFYDAIGFWNQKEGIAVGDPTEDCLSVIITRDAGATWQKLACEQLPSSIDGEALFAASNSSLALFGDQALIGSGGTAARVFKTTDKGKSWSVVPTPITQGASMQGIFSVAVYNQDIAALFGGDWDQQENNANNKAVTLDGGQKWELLSPEQGPGYRSCVRFVPGAKGRSLVAVGTRGISVSYDQGHNWTPLSDTSLYTLRFVNDTLAYGGGPGTFSRLNFEKR